jgi:hypothetical protein
MKNSLIKIFAVTLLSSSGIAMAADERSVTGNVGFVGDRTFRGISQNCRDSVGLKYAAYPCGKAALIRSSRKRNAAELNEINTVGGFSLKHPHALTNGYGISGAAGGGFEQDMRASGDTLASRATGRTMADIAGANLSSKGFGYIEANFGYTFITDHTLMLHAGHGKNRHFNSLSYSDCKIGVSKPVGGFAFVVAYTRTSASDNNSVRAMRTTQSCVQFLRFERKPLVISYAPELGQRIC